MSSKHLLDPELISGLDFMPKCEWTRETLPGLRTLMDPMVAAIMAAPTATKVQRHDVLVPAFNREGTVRLLVYTHDELGAGRPAYLYIHGGGYIIGAPEMVDPRNQMLAMELGCVVVSVDYRLAPETTAPGNVEDCYAALRWLHANARTLGADPECIAIGGDSAGGGLAAALALFNRDHEKLPIVHQQLVYPMLDDRSPSSSHPFTGEFGWTREQNRFGWSCLLGHEPGGLGVSPYAAPARAESLEGLPPAFISVGTLDLFLEENMDYASRLIRAGVPVELHVYPGAYHGSDIVTEARVSKQHARDQLEALRTAFARSAPK